MRFNVFKHLRVLSVVWCIFFEFLLCTLMLTMVFTGDHPGSHAIHLRFSLTKCSPARQTLAKDT